MRLNIPLVICFIFFIGSCRQRKAVEPTIEKKRETTQDSFYTKIKKIYPGLKLQLDTSVLFSNQYKKILRVDSLSCNSFSLNRNYLGSITNVLFEIESNENKAYRCHIKSRNLKLWVCKLPVGLKIKDKILVSALCL